VNRKEFLAVVGGAGAVTLAGTTGFRAKRLVSTYAGQVSAAPEAVFPLLCPVREYEWLDGWRCEMLYSDSGVAEEDCVFRTMSSGPATWSVSRYEPPRRIEYLTFVPDQTVTRLSITLERVEGGTKLHWKRVFTGLSDAANEGLASLWNSERDRELTRRLKHFLKTGKMLKPVTK
jgi:hypothetical protein